MESINPIELLLMEKLEGIDPALDVIGSDSTILQIASQDFINYLKFHWNFVGRESSQYKFVEQLEEQLYGEPAELEAFLSIWVCKWFKKWQERVKLLIGNQKQDLQKMYKPLSNTERRWKKVKHKEELIEMVVNTLLRNGENCGAEILAENLLKEALEKRNLQRFNDKEYVFDFVHDALCSARRLSQSREPLLFVKIDKYYYNSK